MRGEFSYPRANQRFVVNIADENVEMNVEARQAMHLIETGISLPRSHSFFFAIQSSHSNPWSILPLVSSTDQNFHHSSIFLCMYSKCIDEYSSTDNVLVV